MMKSETRYCEEKRIQKAEAKRYFPFTKISDLVMNYPLRDTNPENISRGLPPSLLLISSLDLFSRSLLLISSSGC